MSFVTATLALKWDWVTGAVPRLAVALVPTLVAAVAIGWYVRFLRRTDELMRKIHLEALALGVGAVFLFTTGYRLLERAGAPRLDVSDPVAVLAVGWSVGILLGTRRYA